MIETTPVLMVIMNHLPDIGRISAQEQRKVTAWPYDGVKFLIILLNPCSLETWPWSIPPFWPPPTVLFFGVKADPDVCLSELAICCSSNNPGVTRGCSSLTKMESLVWKWCGQLRVLQVLTDSSISNRLIVIMRNEGRIAGLDYLSFINNEQKSE